MLVYHRREGQKSITWARLAVVILHLEKSLMLITIHKGGVNHQPAVRTPLIYGGKKKKKNCWHCKQIKKESGIIKTYLTKSLEKTKFWALWMKLLGGALIVYYGDVCSRSGGYEGPWWEREVEVGDLKGWNLYVSLFFFFFFFLDAVFNNLFRWGGGSSESFFIFILCISPQRATPR